MASLVQRPLFLTYTIIIYMEVLHENTFVRFELYPEAKRLEIHWKQSKSLTEEDLKDIMRHQVAFVEEHKLKGLLVDTRNFKFTIAPALQGWVQQEVLSKMPTVKRHSFIVTDDFFAQVSVEQTMEQEEAQMKTRYFSSLAEARAWTS